MAGEGAWPVRISPIGPVSAGALAWRTGSVGGHPQTPGGALYATFVVKATFTLVPRGDMAAVEPDELVRAEAHHGDHPGRSIRLHSDLAPFLPRADVVLTGHAVAPAGKPAPVVPVRLAVYRGQALLDKTLHAHGDRKAGVPQPFERMPLVYERAFGGIGWQDNPLGMGFVGGKRVEPIVHGLVDPRDPERSAGFGPISRSWPERRRLLGTVPRRDLDQPVLELPAGFDFTYFQAAPLDQRCAHLQGGEWVIVEGVSADLAQIKSRLPEARAAVRIAGLPIEAPPIELVADTLRIDADTLRCSVTWRGSLAIPDEAWLGAMRVQASVELPGRPISWRDEPTRDTIISLVDEEEERVPTEVIRVGVVAPPAENPFQGTLELSEDASRRAAERPELPFQKQTVGQKVAPTVAAAAPREPVRAPAARAVAPSPPSVSGARAPREIPRRASDGIPVVNRTALVAVAIPCQVRAGQPSRAVIVKGTFDLVPGEPARPRPETEPPTGDRHEGDDLGRSLVYASDFAPFKPKADVTLRGHAFAPGGGAGAAQVGFRFGRGKNAFDRRIAVFGERTWEGVLATLSEPRRFQSIALVYEHAFGGPGLAANPVGLGHEGSTRPPLLEDPDHLITGPGDAPEPVGFGPVPALWAARAGKAGTYGPEWQRARWPYFPDDFDWAYFQAAPLAQQLDHLEGDEPFELVGMASDVPVIDGKLPRLRPRAFVQKTTAAGGAFQEVALRIDTVHFEVDERKITIVWRGLVPVEGDDASDVAELFLTVEPMADPRTPLAEIQARYEAQQRRLPPVGDDPYAPPPANQPEVKDSLTMHERRIRERLKAEGVLESTVVEMPADLPEGPPRAPRHLDPVRKRVEALLAHGAPLADLDLAGADLSDLDFSGRSLAGSVLQGALLRGAVFRAADLRGAQLGGADLTDAVLEGAALTMADLTGAVLDGARLDGAEISLAVLEGVSGDRASFRRAKGKGARLGGSVWEGARFDEAELAGADFTSAVISEAVFDRAVIPEIRLYDARGARVSFRDASLPDARADGVSLTQATLRGAVAPSSIWDGAVLDEASFLGAALAEASFVKASARRAVFSGADLMGARMGRAVLAGASFLKANLMGAQLEGAELAGADLRASNLHGAETWKADLRGADLELAIVTQSKLSGAPRP